MLAHMYRGAVFTLLFPLAVSAISSRAFGFDDDSPAFPSLEFGDVAAIPFADASRADRIIVLEGDTRVEIDLIGVRLPTQREERAAAESALRRMLAGERVFVLEELSDNDVSDESGTSEEARAAAPMHAYAYRAPDGLFINLELVRQGYARADSSRTHVYQKLFRHYETIAREQEKGVWAAGAAAVVKAEAPQRADSASASESKSATADLIVYVTRTGKKYHLADCASLRASKKPLSLAEAIEKHYEPCKLCHPPTP